MRVKAIACARHQSVKQAIIAHVMEFRAVHFSDTTDCVTETSKIACGVCGRFAVRVYVGLCYTGFLR